MRRRPSSISYRLPATEELMAQQLQAQAGSDAWNQALRWASRHARMLAPMTTLVAMFIFFSLVTDVFLTKTNLQNVVTQIGPVAVAAVGVTFVLLCAEIDLSIASIATFSGVLAAYFWVGETISLGNWGIPVAILVAAAI